MVKTERGRQTHRVTSSHDTFLSDVEPLRRELKAHCYRMSGSVAEAEDLVQETLIKAWKGLPAFEGRSSLRRWLYTVATRTCLDALESKQGRMLQSGPAHDPSLPPPPPSEEAWLEPFPDAELPEVEPGPEARYTQRESVALAFLTALQLLPAKQRAVLLLRDVLGYPAAECAELLELSVPSVNSALQRARETLATKEAPPSPPDSTLKALLDKYVAAWANADASQLLALLQDEAIAAMPPFPVWLRGAGAIADFLGRFVMRAPLELRPAAFNGQPAFECFAGGRRVALHVLTVREGRIARLDAFAAG